MTERDLAENAAICIKVGTELVMMVQLGESTRDARDGRVIIEVGAESLRERGAHLKKIGTEMLAAIPAREMVFEGDD